MPKHDPLGAQEEDLRVLNFLKQYYARTGEMPTLREIGTALDICSTDHVSRILRRLTECNCIRRAPYKSRGIVLTGVQILEPVATEVLPSEIKVKLNYSLRFRCQRCHIKIQVEYGHCEDCANDVPLIAYALGEGEERFYQRRVQHYNAFADVRGDRANDLYRPRGAYKH